jgi:hypothetical protein
MYQNGDVYQGEIGNLGRNGNGVYYMHNGEKL